MKVWDIVVELVKWLGAPEPFGFILTIILGFWFVFLVFLFLFLPIFILIRMIKGRR